MPFAIIRGRNGRRHEVDFQDDPVAVDASVSDAVVQITMEAIQDPTQAHKRRFATMAIPREPLMAALGSHLEEPKPQGDPGHPRLVLVDE